MLLVTFSIFQLSKRDHHSPVQTIRLCFPMTWNRSLEGNCMGQRLDCLLFCSLSLWNPTSIRIRLDTPAYFGISSETPSTRVLLRGAIHLYLSFSPTTICLS